MIKRVFGVMAVSATLAIAPAANASVVLGSDSSNVNFGFSTLKLSNQSLSFSLNKSTLVDLTLTFSQAAGNSGFLKSASLAIDQLVGGNSTLKGIRTDSTIRSLGNGEEQITFAQSLKPGTYSLLDNFTLKNSWNGTITAQVVSAVPEPSIYALLGFGVVGLLITRRRSR